MKIPKLYFKYAYPLDQERRQLFANKKLTKYPSTKEVKDKIKNWEKLWKKNNKNNKIFKLVIKNTGINIPRDLEVCIFGGGLNAMSYPLIISTTKKNGKKLSGDEFIEIIIHEIIHRFVADKENNKNIEKYWKTIREEYKKESKLTQNHIIVYALLKVILPEILSKEKSKSLLNPKHPDYQKALKIVNKKGEDIIIKQFKNIIQEK